MSFFSQLGKHMVNGSVTLTSGAPSAVIFTPASDEWTDLYELAVTTDDSAIRSLTVSDGTTILTYAVGGTTGQNPPLVDQSSIPVRFKKGTAITVTASAVTAGKHIYTNARFLTSKT
jgi:hypothetical protein